MTVSPNSLSQSVANESTALHRRTSGDVRLVRPARGFFDFELDQVWRYRHLLATFVRRDVMVIYRQAALGMAWAVIQPIFTIAIFTIVFGKVAKLPIPDGAPYPVFALAALLPWNYFAESVRRTSLGLVNESELIRKVYFPRLVISFGAIVPPLIDLCIGFGILLLMMLAYGVFPTWRFLALPFFIALAGLLGLAVGLLLGPLNVRYRDVKQTLPFLLQIWMYASPVVYAFQMVPNGWRWLYSLNPMVGVIDGFRWAILGRGDMDVMAVGTTCAMTAVTLVIGLIYFKQSERSFADFI